MIKLLLIKPISKAFNGLINGFQHLNFEVKVIEYSSGIEKHKYFVRLKNKLGFDICKYLYNKKEHLNKEILQVYQSFKPDIIYVCQGLYILESTLDHIRKKSFTVLALSDMLSLFPEIHSTFPYYDIIYSYDKSDIELLQFKGYNAKFKPASYDNSIYFREIRNKDCDISFVGTMYSERIDILKKLVKRFPDKKWEIYGEFAPLRFPIKWIKWRLSSEYNYFKNKYLDPIEVNHVYNRSKIVLNIVRANQANGWSARLPQIAGSGAFQITNYFSTVEKTFGDCICTFKSYEDLVHKIEYYLQYDKEREIIARKGFKKVSEEYSLNTVIGIVMEDYNLFKEKN